MNLNLTKIKEFSCLSVTDKKNQFQMNTSEQNIAHATSLNSKAVIESFKLILSLTGIFSNKFIYPGTQLLKKSANFNCTLILINFEKESFSKLNYAVQNRMQGRRVIDMQ